MGGRLGEAASLTTGFGTGGAEEAQAVKKTSAGNSKLNGHFIFESEFPIWTANLRILMLFYPRRNNFMTRAVGGGLTRDVFQGWDS